MQLRRFAFWLPAFIWAVLIFWASSRPIGRLPPWWFDNADKVIHAGLFGTLAAFVFLPLAFAHGWRIEWAALAAFTFATGYGLSDEFHQIFTPSRSSDPYDAMADATGAALAVTVCILLSRAWSSCRTRMKAV